MMQQAVDFCEESLALYGMIEALAEADFEVPTGFRNWTCNDILAHLHFWNRAADLSLNDPPAFRELLGGVMQAVRSGGLRAFEDQSLGGLRGRALLQAWHEFFLAMSARFASADPLARVQWAGPDMSVRSSITARLMETWAHGQAIYDALGVERRDGDRIRNIVILGLNTFEWSFRNRGLKVPGEPPHLKLTAPSGVVWEWNDAMAQSRIEGQATEFCQVVAQTRNVADTGLQVSGEVANQWMRVAQCFAGPAAEPPAPGTRFRSDPPLIGR